MSKTRQQLATRILEKLTVVGTGQSPDAEDSAKADGIIDALSETLSAQDIYTISDITEIEDSAFEWIADYGAYLAAPDFGRARDEVKKQMAENVLYRITATRPSKEPLAVDYF